MRSFHSGCAKRFLTTLHECQEGGCWSRCVARLAVLSKLGQTHAFHDAKQFRLAVHGDDFTGVGASRWNGLWGVEEALDD